MIFLAKGNQGAHKANRCVSPVVAVVPSHKGSRCALRGGVIEWTSKLQCLNHVVLRFLGTQLLSRLLGIALVYVTSDWISAWGGYFLGIVTLLVPNRLRFCDCLRSAAICQSAAWSHTLAREEFTVRNLSSL